MKTRTPEELEKAIVELFKAMPRREWDRNFDSNWMDVKEVVRDVMTKRFPQFDDRELGRMRPREANS